MFILKCIFYIIITFYTIFSFFMLIDKSGGIGARFLGLITFVSCGLILCLSLNEIILILEPLINSIKNMWG